MFTLAKRRDARAVAQVLSGNRDQFGSLVDRYLPAVYAVSYARLHNHCDAEDATQETFLSAFRTLNQLRDPKKFESWLVGIARRTAVKMWEKRKRETETRDAGAACPVAPPDVAREELRQLLRYEIAQLDEDARELLLLHYFAGKSTSELAACLDIGREAAKKRLQRARQCLGERLLTAIGGESEPPKDYRDQRKAIMGLVAASGASWTGNAGAAPLLAANGSAKVAAVAAVAIIAGAGIVVGLRSGGGDAGEAMSGPVSKGAAPVDSVPVTESVEEPVTESEAALPVAPVPAANPSYETPPSIAGLWRACDSLGLLADARIMVLEQSGADIALHIYEDGGPGPKIASGTVEEERIRLTTDDGSASELTGGIQEEGVLVLSGTVLELDPPSAIEITLTRTTERDRAEIEIQEARMAELEAIAGAIAAYAADHGGANPETLTALLPEYLKQPQLVASAPSRRIHYVPDGIWSLETPKDNPNASSHAAQLLQRESDLRSIWSAFPMMEPVLTISYSVPPMTLVYRSEKRPKILRTDEDSLIKCPPVSAAMSASQQNAIQASCQNSLKQLGVVLKMFENMDAEERFPGGWASTVPSCLVDTVVLTCPGLQEKDMPGRTTSYTLLFPAMAMEEIIRIAEELSGKAGAGKVLAPEIPLVTEAHDCTGSGGSHVLFADGHVEWLTLDAWDSRVGPYANYAVTIR